MDGYGPVTPQQPAQPAVAAKTEPSIWSDPNLLAIMLGTMGQAVMGEHQQTWPAQVGRGAVGLGQSFKMAGLMETREEERRKRWDDIIKMISGLGEPGGAAAPPMGGLFR